MTSWKNLLATPFGPLNYNDDVFVVRYKMFCIWEACKKMELLGPKLLSYQVVFVSYTYTYTVLLESSSIRAFDSQLISSSSEFAIGFLLDEEKHSLSKLIVERFLLCWHNWI